MYAERRAPAGTVWTRTTPAGAEEIRILPDGCLDVILMHGRLMVAGPDSVARLNSSPAGTTYIGLRFDPGVGPVALGVPAAELRDRTLPLEDVWSPRRVRRLADAMATAPDPGMTLARLVDGGPPEPWVPAAVGWLRKGCAVAEVAGRLELSERQLHRRCLDAFGYGPKTLGRILRLDRALALVRGGTVAAEAAVLAGYADQPHMAREVRALSGVPLRQAAEPFRRSRAFPGP